MIVVILSFFDRYLALGDGIKLVRLSLASEINL